MDAVTVQAPQTYFTFLKLPPEIRNEIYKYLLDSNQCDISDIDGVEKIHFSANILRTNCLIYSEAHYLLYRANGPVVTISLGLAEAHQYMEEHLVCAYDTRYPAAIKGKLLHIEAVLSLSSMLYRRSIVVVGMKNAMGLANSLRLSMFNGNMKAKYNFDFQRPQTCLGHHYSYDGDESAQQAIMDFFYGIQTPFADSTVSGALNKQSGHRFLAMINSPIVWGRLHSFEKAQMCLQLFNEANDFFLAHRFAFAVRRYRRVIRDFTDGFINCILMSSFEPFESNSKCTKLVSEIILSSHHNLLLCYIEKFKDSCSGTVNMDEEEKAKIVHAVKEAHKCVLRYQRNELTSKLFWLFGILRILFSMPKKKVLDDLHRAIDAQIIPDGDTRNIHQHLDIARSSYTKRSGLQNEAFQKLLLNLPRMLPNISEVLLIDSADALNECYVLQMLGYEGLNRANLFLSIMAPDNSTISVANSISVLEHLIHTSVCDRYLTFIKHKCKESQLRGGNVIINLNGLRSHIETTCIHRRKNFLLDDLAEGPCCKHEIYDL